MTEAILLIIYALAIIGSAFVVNDVSCKKIVPESPACQEEQK